MLEIELVACLSDNYAYLLHDLATGATGVVDPSEPEPVRHALSAHGWRLTHIFNTHHHFDHTGGNLELKDEFNATIIGPGADAERIPGIDVAYGEGEHFEFGAQDVQVFDIPGHTKGHIAFYFQKAKAVFTGDTLFALGCGRMFEGTPPVMFASLSKLAALPGDTRIYCGHEYTQSNGRFALHVDPQNKALITRMADVDALRAKGLPTIPSTIDLERATNPFLLARSAEEFGSRRAAKDGFKG